MLSNFLLNLFMIIFIVIFWLRLVLNLYLIVIAFIFHIFFNNLFEFNLVFEWLIKKQLILLFQSFNGLIPHQIQPYQQIPILFYMFCTYFTQSFNLIHKLSFFSISLHIDIQFIVKILLIIFNQNRTHEHTYLRIFFTNFLYI